MPFTRPTLQVIVDRIESDIESRLTGNIPLLRRAVLRILARVFAGAIHIAYGYLVTISRQLFVDQAETEYLNRHALMWGVPRKAGAFATGDVIFTGTDSTLIPEGTLVQSSAGLEFETLADGTISGGSATIEVQAREAGEEYNLGAATTLVLVSPISGVDSTATVDTGLTGGQDEESDDSLRLRILSRIQEPPAGGTAADYVKWAKTIAGVADAWCFPLFAGPGTVYVVIKAAGTDPVASSALKGQVLSYIDTVKPVTADVYVQELDPQEVEFDIDITPLTDENQDLITANLSQLFSTNAAPGEDMLISRIRNAISTTGIEDYVITAIRVEGTPVAVADIEFTGFEYPVLGTINYSELT